MSVKLLHLCLRDLPMPRKVPFRVPAGARMSHFRRRLACICPFFGRARACRLRNQQYRRLACLAAARRSPSSRPRRAAVPLMPPSFPAAEHGRPLGAHRLPQVEAIARARSRPPPASAASPTSSRMGPTGGVMMHLADQATPEELALKGAPGNKTLYRPEGRPAGQPAGPRGGLLRRPRADPALDGPGSAGPLRHHGLCALRGGGRSSGRSRRPAAKPRPAAAPRPVQPPIQRQ